MSSTVHPQEVASELARAVARRSQTTALFAEPSSAMFYCTRALGELEVPAPYYQMSLHYGSIGHALGGAVGFCAATGQRAAVLTGDGSLHLHNPLAVAVKHRLPIAVVVLNDSGLGLPWFGSTRMKALTAQSTTPLVPWDFSRQGSSLVGARRVCETADLGDAIAEALSFDGCFVVDVAIDAGSDPESDPSAILSMGAQAHARGTLDEGASVGVSPLTGRLLPSAAEVERARQRNLQRGFDERKRLLAGALDVREVARLLAVGRQTPHDRRIAGTLIGVKDRGQWRFPAWQFDADGPDGIVSGLPDVLQALRGPISDLGRVRWFITPRSSLHGRAPIDALRSGDGEAVVSDAQALGVS